MSESSGRVDPQTEPELALALKIGLWCNDSQLEPPDESDGRWRIVGDPTEGALMVAAGKAGLKRNSGHTIVHEIPFDSQRKLMSAVVREAGQKTAIYTKGAPELLLERCAFEQRPNEIVPLSPARREEILQQSRAMADHALRVLGLAWREVDENSKTHSEHDLIFVGLVGHD